MQHLTMQHLGFFVIAWTTLESTLELGIWKRLGIGVRESAVLTAGLQFKSRVATLRTLLDAEPRNAPAIDTLNKIEKLSERNILIHGTYGTHPNGMFVIKRSIGRTLKSTKYIATPLYILEKIGLITDLNERLMIQLDIKEEDYEAFWGPTSIEIAEKEL